MKIIFAPVFMKQFRALEDELREEVRIKIELFKNPINHERLKVHKLHGKLQGCYSFSVNYRFRVVFEYVSKNEVAMLYTGDHDIYG